jgi:5,10-methylenetetrahydromethanopterin reductase
MNIDAPRQVSIAFQTDKTPARYIALAKQVGQYAFDAVSVYCDAPYHPSFTPLALMAPHIPRARMGAAAVAPARIHPIDMAAEIALLAGIAAGGVYLGIARGAWLTDHGIVESKMPIQAIREAVEIVRYLLSGASGGYTGQVYTLAPHVRAPYPLPDVPVPILIGSWGARLCALAGEIADEVKIGGSANPSIVPVITDYIAVGERAAGRAVGGVGVCIGAVTVVDADRGQARDLARRKVALYLPVCAPLDPTVSVEPDRMARVQAHVNAGEEDAAARLISDELLEQFAFAGDPDDLIRQAESLYAAGARRVEFGTPHGILSENGIDLLGKIVVPALKRER